MKELNLKFKSEKHGKNLVFSYISPFLIVTIATLLRFWPLGALELRVTWVTYYPAVIFIGLLYGFTPGLITTILSTLTVLFLSYTVRPFIAEPGDWLGLFIFLFNGSLISFTSGLTHRAKNIATKLKKEADEANKNLEYKILERTKELTASENQLRSLFDFSPFPIMVHDQDGVVVMINKVWTDITGYSLTDIPTISLWAEKAYGEDKDIVKKGIEYLFQLENRIDEGEFTIRTKNGRTVIWDFSSAPLVKIEDGKKLIVSMAKDVTEKVLVDKEIYQTKIFYESIIEGVQDGIWVTDKNDIIYYANTAMENISGLPRDKIKGNNILKDFPKETSGEIIEYYLKAKEENRAVDYNVKVKTPVGRDTFQKGWLIPHYQDNVFLGIICTVHDITAQRLAEEKLVGSEKKFKDFFENAPIGYHSFNSDGYIREINNTELKMIGYNKDEIIGKKQWSDLIIKEEKAQFEKHWVTINELGKIENLEYTMVHKDGSLINVLLNSTMMYDENNNPIRTRGSVIDISKLKQAEKNQKEIENKLRQSQKMDAVGQLAGGVAHDFNNMLAGVVGISELLAEKVREKQDLIKYVNLIIDSCMQASELTQKLLSFSRQDQTQIELMDIHKSINKVTSMLKHSIDKRIEIKTIMNAEYSIISGDKTQIENAILNLCINARDAMPLGGQLTIQTRNIYHENFFKIPYSNIAWNYIEIDITDTGHGMSQEVQERILEPFFTTKELGKGTGLGLTIVYNTIQKNRGFMNIYSEVDKGTTLRISLPITEHPDINDKGNKKDIVIHGSGTILFADDESILRLITSEILSQLGYKVILAENGEDAVNIYKEKQSEIDLVILDVVMPKLNGRDAFYQIKEINSDVKVIISSGFPEDTDTSTLIKDGVYCFVQKPYLKSDLAKKISEVLS